MERQILSRSSHRSYLIPYHFSCSRMEIIKYFRVKPWCILGSFSQELTINNLIMILHNSATVCIEKNIIILPSTSWRLDRCSKTVERWNEIYSEYRLHIINCSCVLCLKNNSSHVTFRGQVKFWSCFSIYILQAAAIQALVFFPSLNYSQRHWKVISCTRKYINIWKFIFSKKKDNFLNFSEVCVF